MVFIVITLIAINNSENIDNLNVLFLTMILVPLREVMTLECDTLKVS